MHLSKYVACICEGTAEQVIINILLDNNKLIFTRANLIEEDILRCRSGKKFEEQYLRKGYIDKITVIRILDSRRENFKISKAYRHKIDVINVITAPEIEMLVILSEDKYKAYKASKKKPSEYCIQDLGYGNVKSKKFIETYFANVSVLTNAIREYKRVSNISPKEYSLADILA